MYYTHYALNLGVKSAQSTVRLFCGDIVYFKDSLCQIGLAC